MRYKTDKDIVRATLEDINNYRYLVEKYEDKLLRYIKRLLYLNNEDAEDILQEVFIKAYKNINSYNSNYKFSSWIYRIAHNESVSFLRRNKNIRKNIPNDPEFDIFETIAADIDLEKENLDQLNRDKVVSSLDELDKKSRNILILKYLEEKDYKEISEILRIPVGTVGSLIHRAKFKLKNLLIKNGKI